MRPYRASSKYVVAAGDCYVSFHGNFMDRYSDGSYYNDDNMKSFLSETGTRFLYSFGSGISYETQKIGKRHTENIAKKIRMMHDRPFMSDSKIYVDSGGFQVAMGALKTSDMPKFIDMYCDFLMKYDSIYHYAFSLDLPPGPLENNVFTSYDQLEKLNRSSYQKLGSLPDNIKKKLIYVHHFRTPSIYDTWNKFLFHENLAEGYDNFATGGIVANMATDQAIPVILYCIPLSEILYYNKKLNKKSFNFHVLGGANHIDVFYHKLFEHHIKQVHDVDVNITYDSSALFKALAQGRFVPVFKSDGSMIKMDLHSAYLHQRFEGQQTIEEKLYEILNECTNDYGFRKLTPKDDPVYTTIQPSNCLTFSRSIHMYGMCYFLYNYCMMEAIAKDYVQRIYPYYLSRDQETFDAICNELSVKLNGGKRSKKQTSKISSLFRSLDLLTHIDLSYNRNIITKYLSNDDISSMSSPFISF